MSINKVCLVAFIALFSTSCANNDWFITHNGNMPSEERIGKLAKGQNKDEVMANLGAPSSIISLDRNTWLYMSSEVERIAFFEPDEISRDILVIRFNDENNVENIQRLTQKDGKIVEISDDKTQTLGHEPGFFERYFGGVGTYMPFAGRRNPNM